MGSNDAHSSTYVYMMYNFVKIKQSKYNDVVKKMKRKKRH